MTADVGCENHPDRFSGFFHNDNLLGVLILEVSKGRNHDNALFLLLTISCADSPAAVSSVEVIDQSLESNDEIIRLIKGVDIFGCREYPNVVFPQIVDEQSGLGTVPSQPGEVFHYDGLDQSGFYHFIDFIDSGTIEVHPADIVIEGFAHDFVSIGNGVVVDDIPLIAERIKFLVLISGETIVEPDFHSRHLLSGRVDFANRTYHRHL